MSNPLKDFFASGKVILTDTKQKVIKTPLKKPTIHEPVELDPHKNLVKRAIQEKMKKTDIVEVFEKMCRTAEDAM